MTDSPNYSELVPLFTRYRALIPGIQDKLIQAAGDGLQERFRAAGADLELLDEDEVVAGSEFELGLIADYTFYDRLDDGTTAVELLLASSPPDDPDEAALLAALARSHCGLFMVHTIEADAGVGVVDYLGSRTSYVVSPNIASVAGEGTVFAARLVELPDLTIPAGTAYPLDTVARDEITTDLADRFPLRALNSFHDLPAAERAEVNRIVTRAMIEAMEWQFEQLAAALGDDFFDALETESPPAGAKSAKEGQRLPRGQRPKPTKRPTRKGKRKH